MANWRRQTAMMVCAGAVMAAGAAAIVAARNRPPAGSAFPQAALDLFESLPNGDETSRAAHRRVWEELSRMSADRLPANALLQRILAERLVPHDYQFFFNECLPRYRAQLSPAGAALRDDNVIVSVPGGAPLHARLFLNEDNATPARLRRIIGMDRRGNRAAFAAAYTSPFNIPAGLTMLNGAVVNPVLKRSGGLLIMDPEGYLLIASVGKLHDGLRRLDIRSSLADYQTFVRKAIDSRWSIIQGNFLVDGGRLVVDDHADRASMPRRVLFATEDGGVHVYDSLGKAMSLGEAARVVAQRYGAADAFELETGPNDLCFIKSTDRTGNYGHVEPGAIVSNVVVLEF